jgi:hypothetical protein
MFWSKKIKNLVYKIEIKLLKWKNNSLTYSQKIKNRGILEDCNI